MASRPLVSVVMTVHNGAKYIDACIASILQQTFSDFEFIVLDDGSTDSTLAILTHHQQLDPRIKIISEPRRGLPECRNRVCAEAGGKYLAMMDADDISFPQRLEVQVEYMEAHEEVALLGAQAQCMDENGPISRHMFVPLEKENLKRRLLEGNCFVATSVMLRREFFLSVGGYRLPLAEDYDLWLRIGDRHEVANLKDILVYYRVHPEQATSKQYCLVLLMAIGASYCARLRRAGKGDPLNACPVITHRWLLDIGVPASEIEQQLLGEPLNRAAELLQGNHHAAGIQLLYEIYGLLAAQHSSGNVRGGLAFRISQFHHQAGHRFFAIIWRVRAYLLDPLRFKVVGSLWYFG